MENKIWDLVEHEAAKSPCKKRRVGAVLVDGESIVTGYNHNPVEHDCEDGEATHPDTVHAEIDMITKLPASYDGTGATLYVNHQPCDRCLTSLGVRNITDIRVSSTAEKWPGVVDPINPKHYSGLSTYKGAAKNQDAYEGFLHLNAFKYIERMWHKEKPKQDLEKAQWYLGKLKDEL